MEDEQKELQVLDRAVLRHCIASTAVENTANNYKYTTFLPVLKNHAFLYSLMNLFKFFNMWLVGINPLFIFLQSV